MTGEVTSPEPINPGSYVDFIKREDLDPAVHPRHQYASRLTEYRHMLAEQRGISPEELHDELHDIGRTAVDSQLESA